MTKLYGEDFTPGTEFPFSSVTLSEDDIIDFARQWDPQPMHTDPASAEAQAWGGLIASGMQTSSVYQRLVVEALWSKCAVKAGRAFTVNLRRPVRPGTTLTGKVVIGSVRQRHDRGDAIVDIAAELWNDDREVVLEIALQGVIYLRDHG